MAGCTLEWIETDQAGTTTTSALEGRLRGGHVAAVVVIEGLVGHRHSEPVVAAAKLAGVPLAFAGTGGLGQLREALESIERSLVNRDGERT